MELEKRLSRSPMDFYRRRGYSEDIEQAMLFVKRYWKDVLLLGLPLLILLNATTHISLPYFEKTIFGGGGGSEYILSFLFNFCASFVLSMSLMFSLVEFRRKHPEGDANYAQILGAMVKPIPLLLLYFPIALLLLTIGAIFLYIPFIYLLVPVTIGVAIACFENIQKGFTINIFTLLKKAFRYGNLLWGNTFMLVSLSIVIGVTISIIPMIPFSLAGVIIYYFDLGKIFKEYMESVGMLEQLAHFFLLILYSSYQLFFITAAFPIAFRYFNLEEIASSVSLKQRIERLNKPIN